MTESPEDWFWRECSRIERQSPQDRSELEAEMLEFADLRPRAGGDSSVLYYIDSYQIRPSRLASLLTKLGPPQVAAVARDLSRLYPDDMPQEQEARQAYIEARFAKIESLNLPFESSVDDPFAALDDYCLGDLVDELYVELRQEVQSS